MPKITDIAHLLLENHIKPGNTVIDATCGNGYDTLFLAKLVGPNGIVHSYDIQEDAINKAKYLTKDFQNIIFHLESHENIDITNINSIIFNLGYLPTGNKEITTMLESTKNALIKLLERFEQNKDMLIVIVVYPGHPEGQKESTWLLDFGSNLDSSFLVSRYMMLNQNNAPYIISISKK